MRLAAALLLGALTWGCAAPRAPAQLVDDEDVRIQVRPRVQLLGTGLSGVAMGRDGRVWAVAEREHFLVSFAVEDAAPGARIPVRGIAKSTDAESLAWLEDGRLAIGTETQEDQRDSDDVLVVELAKAGAHVVRRVPLRYPAWGIRARANQGIEGLCSAGNLLVAAVETVVVRGRERTAPIARGDLSGNWTPFELRLTSAEGKISALDCKLRGSQLMVVAVERHYGITRILRFKMPVAGRGAMLEPVLVADLTRRLDPLPNVEGIGLREPGLLLLTDHDSPELPGATETIQIGPFSGREDSWRWLDE